jgi:L-ascorbate metabolism protein UlaG (beta-lactamase superfamily)
LKRAAAVGARRWYVPLGIKAWFEAEGIANVEELDWWQETEHVSPSGAKVSCGSTLHTLLLLQPV